MKWDRERELKAINMRNMGETYKSIALQMGLSESSVKHKIRRLGQSDNQDKYKHTAEKTEIAKIFINSSHRNILETHSGFGGMTEFYNSFGEVEAYDIDKKRVDFVNDLGLEGVTCIKADSEKEIYRLVYHSCNYDLIDIDSYGMPSRYFPHSFNLIKDGLMFITLPMIGVAQMNKITIRHLQSFWGVDYQNKEDYVNQVVNRLKDFAFTCKRDIEVLDITKIDRIYRITLSVKKKSLCEIVGLEVKRSKKMDELIRNGISGTTEKLYIHQSMQPLTECDFDPARDQIDLFNNECEGMCGV